MNGAIKQSRFAAIDALRGIAALLVVLQHTSESFVKLPGVAQHGTLLADISKNLDFGRIGIICFFLISGFVIPSGLKAATNQPIKKFAIRRFFRLYPAYWLSMLLAIGLATWNNHEIQTSTIIANTTMLQSFFSEHHLIGLYWTLQIELVFYCLCALLFTFGLLKNDRFIFTVILAFFSLFVLIQIIPFFSSVQINWNKEFQLLPYLLSLMFLGSFYRKIYDKKSSDNKLKYYTIIGTVLCLGLPVFLLATSLLGYNLIENSFRFGVAHSLAFLLFFMGLHFLKSSSKPILWLGTISYSLYLLHPLVMQVTMKFVNSNTLLQGYHLSIYILTNILISVFIASIIYKFIEKPAIDLGHRLSRSQ